MTERTILGIDPGGVTGIILLDWAGELPATPEDSRVVAQTQLNPDDAEDFIADLINDGKIDHVAIEKFTIGPGTVKMSRQYDALYVIGAVRYMARTSGVDLLMQQPASAKNAYSDTWLRQLGWHGKVAGRHARDALRHALLATHAL